MRRWRPCSPATAFRVCLVDKDHFPSDTASTHGIQPIGVQVLERIGVLDSLLKLAPPILRLRMVLDDAAAPAADVVAITGAPGLSVRRIVLDEILVNAAADAGAEVRLQTAVTGLVMDGGRVAGVATPGPPRSRHVLCRVLATPVSLDPRDALIAG